jgi:hypothetical protein
VVCKAVVPRNTWAPETNLSPVTVRVKFPVLTDAGLIPISTGVGLRIVTLLDPLADASATLVARTVTGLGFGNAAGAVKFPVESIVPVAADPPVVPFTAHSTPVFCAPVTLALNGYESPARTFAVAGDTETLTPVGGGCLPEETPPAQPADNQGKSVIPAAQKRGNFDFGTLPVAKRPSGNTLGTSKFGGKAQHSQLNQRPRKGQCAKGPMRAGDASWHLFEKDSLNAQPIIRMRAKSRTRQRGRRVRRR